MITASQAKEMLKASIQAMDDRVKVWCDSVLPELEASIFQAIKLNQNSITKSVLVKTAADDTGDSPSLYAERLAATVEKLGYKVSYHHDRGGGYMFTITF